MKRWLMLFLLFACGYGFCTTADFTNHTVLVKSPVGDNEPIPKGYGDSSYTPVGADGTSTNLSEYNNDAGFISTLTNQNEGVVKINSNGNGSDPTYSLVDEIEQQITYTNFPLIIDPTSSYPENATNQDWTAIYFTNGVSTNIFLENQVLGQVQFWRMDVSWTNKTANNNAGLTWTIENPVSGFERHMQIALPSGLTYGRTTFPAIYTYTDTNSAAAPLGVGLGGYEFYIRVDNDNIAVTINDITRFSAHHD